VLSASVADVHDTSGDNIGAVAVFRDFTREAEIERVKSAFVAMVSHELRTPLNAILGFAEMLKESVYGPINPKQSESAGRILTNTQRLLGIVNDLLDQAQIEAGKLAIRARPCQPAEMVENVRDLMSRIAADRGLTLTCEIDPELPPAISGDATRLEQIMVNLLNNAIKFTEQGSIYLNVFRIDEDHWAIQVKDTGQGIPEGDRQIIFDAFEQADKTSVREHGGVGLGLTIVKNLTALMGGDVTLDSAIARGSTFTVTLPLIAADMETTL
jgi:signal transduction histidine kinase